MQMLMDHNSIEHVVNLISALNFKSMADFICWRVETDLYFGGGNYYICDCLDFNFLVLTRSLAHLSYFVDMVCCNILVSLTVQAIQVPLADLGCTVQDNCPIACQGISQPSDTTFHVICLNIGFNDAPETIPNSTAP